MTRPQDAATEALAATLASLDRCAKQFWLGKNPRAYWNNAFIYKSFCEDAAKMQRRLERRGYVIRKARKSG